MSQDTIQGMVIAVLAALLIGTACLSGPSPLGKSISRQIGKMQKHKSEKIQSKVSEYRKRAGLSKKYERVNLIKSKKAV